MAPASDPDPPPRVLLVIPAHWPRALLRAELREHGYDALGARDLEEALVYEPEVPDRGSVRLIVVDRDALAGAADAVLPSLLARHGRPDAVLLSPAGQPLAAGPWRQVIRRPTSIADIVRLVGELLPLAPERRRPLDS